MLLQVLGEFAFAQPFGFLEAGQDIDNMISGIAKTVYEGSMVAKVPLFEDVVRSNPLWKLLPIQANMDLLVNTAMGTMGKYEAQKSDDDSVCLLKSLLAAHKASPEKFSTTDVLSISMGAM